MNVNTEYFNHHFINKKRDRLSYTYYNHNKNGIY